MRRALNSAASDRLGSVRNSCSGPRGGSGNWFLPIPPATAERLEQRDRIRQPIGFGLHDVDRRLKRALFDQHNDQRAHVAQFELAAGDSQAAIGRLLSALRNAQRIGVGLRRMQRIGDVLEGIDVRRSIVSA